MTSEEMKYHIERMKSFDLAEREWRARQHIRKSQREREQEDMFNAICYGIIIFLILLLLVTR